MKGVNPTIDGLPKLLTPVIPSSIKLYKKEDIMKKITIVLGLGALMFAAPAFAGVSKIQNNGKISGVPSYRVECTSGSSKIIYKKNGTWYTGGGGHMGNRYNSWSVNDVADYVCS